MEEAITKATIDIFKSEDKGFKLLVYKEKVQGE